jgi:hypothetical protein
MSIVLDRRPQYSNLLKHLFYLLDFRDMKPAIAPASYGIGKGCGLMQRSFVIDQILQGCVVIDVR